MHQEIQKITQKQALSNNNNNKLCLI